MVLIFYESMDKVEDKVRNLGVRLRINQGFLCITYTKTQEALCKEPV